MISSTPHHADTVSQPTTVQPQTCNPWITTPLLPELVSLVLRTFRALIGEVATSMLSLTTRLFWRLKSWQATNLLQATLATASTGTALFGVPKATRILTWFALCTDRASTSQSPSTSQSCATTQVDSSWDRKFMMLLTSEQPPYEKTLWNIRLSSS